MVRAENAQGLSVPSGLSNVAKTLESGTSVFQPGEISVARSVLSGKVNFNTFFRFSNNNFLKYIKEKLNMYTRNKNR